MVEKLQNIQIDLKNFKVTFQTQFLFDPASFGNGLMIVVVMNSIGSFVIVDIIVVDC